MAYDGSDNQYGCHHESNKRRASLRTNRRKVHVPAREDALRTGTQQFACAFHAGGLALECVLKAKIAKSIVAEEFPDKKLAEKAWGHDPASLLKLGDLERFMDQAPAEVRTNWAIVKDWSIDSRYNLAANPLTVGSFLDALDDRNDGILPWLLKHC